MPLSAIVNRGAVVGRYAHYQLRFGGAFSVESAKGQRSPMSIRQYLQGHRFDDETVRRLGIAYEMTLVALRQRREDDPLRTAAAQKIIELAKAGERNPERLCDGALKATQPPGIDHRLQSSSASRPTAEASGFLNLSQSETDQIGNAIPAAPENPFRHRG